MVIEIVQYTVIQSVLTMDIREVEGYRYRAIEYRPGTIWSQRVHLILLFFLHLGETWLEVRLFFWCFRVVDISVTFWSWMTDWSDTAKYHVLLRAPLSAALHDTTTVLIFGSSHQLRATIITTEITGTPSHCMDDQQPGCNPSLGANGLEIFCCNVELYCRSKVEF